MKRLTFFVLFCTMAFCQSFSQDLTNRYITEYLEDSNLIVYQHNISHKKDKSKLSKKFVFDVASYMGSTLDKQLFKEQFICNLSNRFTYEKLLDMSLHIQALSFKLDINNELYDISFFIKRNNDVILSDEDLDLIVECLSIIIIDFNIEELEKDMNESISMNERPYSTIRFGKVFWEKLYTQEEQKTIRQ